MLEVCSPLVQGGNVCKWADDSQQFILEHFETIHGSPSLIYHSALLLSPLSSWLHTYYTPQLLQGPKVVRGVEVGWGACSRTVSLDSSGQALSCWSDTIAVGSGSGKIITLSAITGSQMAVLSGHTNLVHSLTFSSDGRSLVSGSYDQTVKFWDVQTGGVVQTFYGHTDWVYSVSISVDCTRIALGSGDHTIRLWDIQTGECLCTIQRQQDVFCVSFSPLNPQHIFSVSDDKICEWDTDGYQIPSTYDGSHIIFSPDHTKFALCNGNDITVQNSDSRTTVARFNVSDYTECFCFSPDGNFIAAAVDTTAYVWDITSQDPHLIATFIDHTDDITSLVFSSPSSLVSVSDDVKFWKIGTSPSDNISANSQSTPFCSAWIKSITLQARDGIVVSSDRDGVVKTWDISTGVCKASFQTPAGDCYPWAKQDARLIDSRLIFIWCPYDKIHVWEIETGELLQTLVTPQLYDLRISGDGSCESMVYVDMGACR